MTLLPFRSRDDDRSPVPDDATTRALRDAYATPGDGYWDGFEARVIAAVSRAAAAGQAPLEWWDALAGWTRPALAAAAVALFVAGAAMFQARDARAHVAFEAVIDGTPVAGGGDVVPLDGSASEVEELLRAGVERPRRRMPRTSAESTAAASRGGASVEVLRYVQPE